MLKVNFLVEPHYLVNRHLVRDAAQLAAKLSGLKTDAEITISIIGDRKMKTLNQQFRGKDATTNVLSFNTTETESISHFKSPETKDLYLGDVAVSYPVALQEAIKENVLVDERVAFLVTHGILHLFGMDHEDPEEAKKMEKLEDQVTMTLKASEIIK